MVSDSQPVLRVDAGAEPYWIFDTNKLEPGRRYQIILYAVNDKGQSDPPVTLYAVAPPSAEVIDGVELRGNMLSRPPLDALASGSGGGAAGGLQTAPVAVVLGALIACAVLILCAVALAVTLVVCRRRREARREAEEARRRDDFREAVRGSQVVVGSLKRQPVTPGEEDQFGILVTATSPNSSVVGIREGQQQQQGQQQQAQQQAQQHVGTLGRPHVPAVGAAAAARSLGAPVGHAPAGPAGHPGPGHPGMAYPMGHNPMHGHGPMMGHAPMAVHAPMTGHLPMTGHNLMPHPQDDPRRLNRPVHEQDPAGAAPCSPMGPVMGPPMTTTIIGSGGGVLNRIRNNNDPDLIISRAEVVLKPLNTSRC
ncbi:Neural cell adhesion molecule 2 [Frankliniella fusca]|uniref:Neural cell adhesion molecule 2 n=1 Tax=Frankliniella fusca TaxID=407009 RepID=A0AAE1HKX5_9NEOP|nr:Neural cell adhesion molecule 2 [Frankliniella fusca]